MIRRLLSLLAALGAFVMRHPPAITRRIVRRAEEDLREPSPDLEQRAARAAERAVCRRKADDTH